MQLGHEMQIVPEGPKSYVACQFGQTRPDFVLYVSFYDACVNFINRKKVGHKWDIIKLINPFMPSDCTLIKSSNRTLKHTRIKRLLT